MIGIDSNIRVRLLVGDDAAQHAAARLFFSKRLSGTSPGYVSLVVLVEVWWVLTRVYRQPLEVARAALLQVVDAEQIVAERVAIARTALDQPTNDFADILIQLVGADAGCSMTVTFDKRFARRPGVELLA